MFARIKERLHIYKVMNIMLSIDFIQRLKIFFRLCNRVLRTFTYQQCKVGITIAYIKDERIKRGNSNVT